MSKELLFSLTKKDFRVDTFRAGGKGGQKQNKTNSGVRVTHIASGAVGEGRDERSQVQNRKNAFTRCINSDIFQKWYKLECAKKMGLFANIQSQVDKMMSPDNLKIETFKFQKATKNKD